MTPLVPLLLPLILSAPAVERTLTATYRDSMSVLTDGKSHYLLLAEEAPSFDQDRLYYGDGKTFYQVIDPGRAGTAEVTRFGFWDPRGGGPEVIRRDGSKFEVYCKTRITPVQRLAKADALALLARAKFFRSPMVWQAYALMRDDRGTYYYVDRGRFADNAKRFRLFIGQKGNMPESDLVNIVSDSAGDIFSTKSGELRLVMSKDQSTWIAKEQKTTLTMVRVRDNMELIYGDLGVYKDRFGTPCDDF